MTSSNGNFFRVTDPVLGEFTGHRWIPLTKASDHGLWFFFDLSLNKLLSKQLWGWWFETPWHSLWRHCNGVFHQNRPYLHVLVVSTGQPLIRSIILYSCLSNIQENDIKWYKMIYGDVLHNMCFAHNKLHIHTVNGFADVNLNARIFWYVGMIRNCFISTVYPT